jgi:hypothetical protein
VHPLAGPVLREWEPFRRMVTEGEGAAVRAMFRDRHADEAHYRKRLKAENYWLR